MSLIETYNNADNAHRQEMFYEYLKKTGLKESTSKQYSMSHPSNEAVLAVVNNIAKKSSLFEVVDLFQVTSIYNKVKETEANKRVNNALSATVYNYKKFLDYLETQNTDTALVETEPTPFSLYKQDLPKYWNNEKYKWEAVKCFQDNWNIDAEDFGEMFKKATSKHLNLLASMKYYPVGMILQFAEVDKERTRNMFRVLYDESKNLADRINFFIDESEAIRKTHDAEWKNRRTRQTLWSRPCRC